MTASPSSITDRHPTAVPDTFSPAAFAGHAQTFLAEWLADFTWDGKPMTGALSSITAHVSTDQGPVPGTGMTLWVNTADSWLGPAGVLAPDAGTGLAMSEDPFHETWDDLIDGYRLAGTWLHPDTLFEVDPYSWATGRAALAVGTRDRNDPTAPRRYNPDLRCDINDLGVVYFPVRAAFRAPEWIADGHSPERTSLLVIATALAEAGCHEALEMHQTTPGQPVWDPHAQVAGRMSLTITHADGYVTQGTAH
jgi:hypothetical protein